MKISCPFVDVVAFLEEHARQLARDLGLHRNRRVRFHGADGMHLKRNILLLNLAPPALAPAAVVPAPPWFRHRP